MKRLLSIVLALLLGMALPLQAMAAEYDLSQGSVTVTADGVGPQTVTHGSNAAVEDAAPVITQSTPTTENTITITGGGKANVEISGVNIDTTATHYNPAIQVTGDTTANLTVTGSNTVESGQGAAGVEVEGDNKIVIQGDGALNAQGGEYAAGIGGGRLESAGTIEITGGEVNATGGNQGAGIGAGGAQVDGQASYTVDGGTVIISGGSVTAQGGRNAAGIGGGFTAGKINTGTGGDGGNITISGGNVTASGADGASDLGGGRDSASDGTITITGGIVNGVNYAPAPEEETSAAPSFWDQLLWKVNSAEEGSTVTLDLGSYTYIANTIIKAAQKRSITLIIQWTGGEDITIAPTDTIDLTMWRVELADLTK